MTALQVPRGLALRSLTLSVVVAAIGYLAFVLWGGWSQVLAAISMVGVGGVCIALFLSLANYALRFGRWQMYLRALGTSVPPGKSALIYVAGFALTTTPGKAGEMVRGVYLRRYGLSLGKSGAAFISERLSDLIAIVLLALMGLLAYPGGWVLAVPASAAVVGLLMLVSQPMWLIRLREALHGRAGIGARGAQSVLGLLIGAAKCHRPALLAGATTLSLVAWAAEALGAWFVMRWLGFDAGLLFAFAVYALAMLAGALSFLPGGLGGTEAVMVATLIHGGMPESQAVAATVIIRLATLWFAVGLGICALIVGGPSLQEAAPTGGDGHA